jgi:phosphatidylethanolamine/phosphatidyl-N-methylethanolamine N-methyltransferase
MNNGLNKIIYKLWSPFYDRFFNSGDFLEARKKLFEQVQLEEGDRVLFVGVGTGADLENINSTGLAITGIDYSKDMLEVAKNRVKNTSVTLLEMDAQHLQFADESFDVVVASLILTVVPDGKRCMDEMVRVTRRGGKIVIFDKFLPKHSKLGAGKRILRPMISLLGTDIGRSFESMAEHLRNIEVTADDLLFERLNVAYRRIVVRK